MITKAQLIEMLAEYDDDDIIVITTDDEGTTGRPIYNITPGVYSEKWNGIFVKELTDELKSLGLTEDDLCHSPDGINCITLWP